MYKEAIKSGLIIGIVTVIISLLAYVIDFTIFAKWWYNLILMSLVSITLVAILGRKYRDENLEYMKFGQAYLFSLVSLLVSSFIGTLFMIVLVTVIDVDLAQNLTDEILRNTESMMSRFGAPEEAIDEQMEQLREDMPKQFSAGGMIKSFFTTSLIFTAIISAIASIFLKKSEPEEDI